MRRGPLLLIAVGVLLLFAGIPIVLANRPPTNLVTDARFVLSPVAIQPSPSATPTAPPSAAPQPTGAAQRSAAAVAAAAAPPTAVTARISIPPPAFRQA